MFTREKNGDSRNKSAAPILRFRKGEIITGQGEPATHWYKVISGTVRSCIFYSDGRRQLTGFHYRDDIFGLDQDSYIATCEAVTDVCVQSFAKARGDRQVTNGEQSNQPQPMTTAALVDAMDCIAILGRKTAVEKIAAFLFMTARKTGRLREVQLPMSRSDIADHLGLTIHTVSRSFTELARREIIDFDGPHIARILNWPGLADLSGEDEISMPTIPQLSSPPLRAVAG